VLIEVQREIMSLLPISQSLERVVLFLNGFVEGNLAVQGLQFWKFHFGR